MSFDGMLKNVKEEISNLINSEDYSRFHHYLEKIQQWSNAEIYSDDILTLIIEIIKAMNNDTLCGKSVEEVVEKAREGEYIQSGWEVDNVYQHVGGILQIVLNSEQKHNNEQVQKKIPVHVVLVVMNKDQLLDLCSENILGGDFDEARKNFIEVRNILNSSNDNREWEKRYHSSPQKWQPFDERSINEIIHLTLNSIQEGNREYAFYTEIVNICALSKNRVLLKKLRYEGCIVIVDLISLCHPRLLKAFQQSMLDAYPNNFVVALSPIPSIFSIVRKMKSALEFYISEMEFSRRRLDEYEEYGACREIFDIVECQQWLRDRFKKTVQTNEGIQKYIHKFTNTDE